MPVQPPSSQELARIAETFGMRLEGEELEQLTELAAGAAAGYARLDELEPPSRAVGRPPTGHRPEGEENVANAWTWRCSIREAEEGPLAGVRVAVKDNICLAGVPMLNGSPIMEGFVPGEDATVVTRLLAAGAEIVGKTAVPAFCFDGGGCTGWPKPEPLNPHDAARLPGSSSNGSAVAVATGQADMALGGDQGGSVRLPSSWTGTVGHKPTWGLVPYTGAFPIELTLDHLGPITRSARDCARMLDVIAGDDGLDPRTRGAVTQPYAAALDGSDPAGLRVGVLAEGFDWPDVSEPDVDAAVRGAAAALADAGAEVREISVPMHRDGLAIWNAIATEGATELMVAGDSMGTNWRGHYTQDLLDFYAQARRRMADAYSPTVKLTVLLGRYVAERHGHHYYAKAQNLSRELAGRYDAALAECDVLLMPTTAMKAQPRPADDAPLAEVIAAALGNLHNTAVFDATGHPAISVPCAISEGLPVGLMLVGRRYDDATVLRAADAFERVRGELPALVEVAAA